MLLNYTGTRPFVSHDFRHQRFIFDKKNFFVCDVTDNDGARFLIETGEYMPITEDIAKELKKKAIDRKKRVDKLSKPEVAPDSAESKVEEPEEAPAEPKEEAKEEKKKKKSKKSKKSAK